MKRKPTRKKKTQQTLLDYIDSLQDSMRKYKALLDEINDRADTRPKAPSPWAINASCTSSYSWPTGRSCSTTV